MAHIVMADTLEQIVDNIHTVVSCHTKMFYTTQ